jgi:ribose transport system substrate-binding protein
MSYKKTSPLIVLGLLLVFSLVLSGCGSTTTTQPAGDTSPTPAEVVSIGILMPEQAAFFETLADGANEAAIRLNVTPITRFAANDIATQNSQIQEMVEMGVKAIVITPVDGEGVVDAIEAAAAAGIAIFTVDRSIETDVVVSHIASDNLAGGKMAGDYLAEAIGGQGQVVELLGIPGTSAARDRGAGFNEAIAGYPNIEIVAQEVANFNRAEGETVFSQILAEQPQIAAVFAHNDEMILGAIRAAQAAGRAGEIRFVGFDAVDDAVTALEAGELTATIAQQPAEMGRLGLETAVKHLQGESVPAAIPVDLAIIR